MAIKSGYTAEDLAKLGPDVLTRKRLLAEAMLNDSTKQRKIAHPLQGMQQLAETLVNGLDVRKIDKATMTGQDAADKDWSSLFGGGSTNSAIPTPSAAGEISATSPSVSPSGNTDVSGVETYIREAATKRGIDPDVAVKVARSEGLAPGVWQSNVVKGGQRETSYGPFQLLVGGGLGDKFQKIYGKSPADPSTVNQQIDFALDEAATGGWSPWYGAAKVGVGSRTGLDRAKALGYNPTQVASLDPGAGMSAPAMPAPAAQAQMQGPQPPAPPLPPPTTSPNAPQAAAQPPVSPQGSPAPQQLAQALTGQSSVPSPPQGPSPQDLAKILSNPWVSDERKQVARMLLGQQGQRQQAQYEQQLQQSDPKYQTELQKSQLELQNLREPKMSPAEQAADQRDREKMAFDREKFDAEVKKGQWQKLTDGRLYNQTTGEFKDAPPPVPGSVPPKMDDISGMRKEIQQLPSYKNLAQAAPIYKAMAETAGRNTKASDLNLVYGLGKIMDPTSVVREGEMVMVKNTASIPDWFQGVIASLNGGAALTPETRQAIMTEAYGRVKGYRDEFSQNLGQYQGIVQRNGINPADVIPEVENFEPWKMPEAPSGAVPSQDDEPVPEGMDPEIWKFVPPEDRKLWRK